MEERRVGEESTRVSIKSYATHDLIISMTRLRASQAGLVGKGKDTPSLDRGLAHQSRPVSTLKDPASFGPPPKHIATTGNPPVSDYTPPPLPAPQYGVPTSSEPESSGTRIPPVPQRVQTSSPSQSATTQVPSRPDAQFPTPPVRRPANSAPVPPSRSSAAGFSASASAPQPKPKPSLPPRLPPRQNSNPLSSASSPPPTYDQALQQSSGKADPVRTTNEGLNRGAVDRLGQAGISVPELNIGGGGTSIPGYTSSDPVRPAQSPSSISSPAGGRGQVSELQQRFAKMGVNLEASSGDTPSPAAVASAKKPPPPPPRNKPRLSNNRAEEDETGAPPPIPLGSKPGV